MNFEDKVKELVKGFQLFFRDDLILNDKQKAFHAGGDDVYDARNKFKTSVPDIMQHSKSDMHPFRQLINVLLEKKIITTKDDMSTLAQKIIENKHLIDHRVVGYIKGAAISAGFLKEDFLTLWRSTYLDFEAIAEKNKRNREAAPVDRERKSEKKSTSSPIPTPINPVSERSPSPDDSLYLASSRSTENGHFPSTPRSPEVQNTALSGDKQLLAALKQRAESTDRDPNMNSQAKLKAIFQNLKAGQYSDTVRFEPDKHVQQQKLDQKKEELQGQLAELKNARSEFKEKRNEAYQAYYKHEQTNPEQAEIANHEFHEYSEKYKECTAKVKELESVLKNMEEEEQDDTYMPDSPSSSY